MRVLGYADKPEEQEEEQEDEQEEEQEEGQDEMAMTDDASAAALADIASAAIVRELGKRNESA